MHFKIVIIILSFIFFGINNISANGTAGHYILLQKVYESLPDGSIIKKAIKDHPEIAAAGAIGPDIGVAENFFRGIFQYAPWADRYHYDRVGSMAVILFKLAINEHNDEWLAFATGWLTHVIGDMSIHGIYINPEAGVYLDNPAGRDLHIALEHYSEPFIWEIIGGQREEKWLKSYDLFCGSDNLPYDLINKASYQIWNKMPGKDFRLSYIKYMAGLSGRLGPFSYIKLNNALKDLNVGDRKKRILDATNSALKDSLSLLKAAEKNDYSGFSNMWNLDALDPKYDHRTVGTLVVSVKTADSFGAGTDADIYFGFINDAGSSKQWILDKDWYQDLETNDNDDYYFYLYDPLFALNRLKKIYLVMEKHYGVGNDWDCSYIEVRVNGEPVMYYVNKKFINAGDKWETSMKIKK